MTHLEKRSSLLIVDDTPDNITVLTGVLSGIYKIRAATSGSKALTICLGANPPDLILLDIMMPIMDGFEVCKQLKNDVRLRDIPVIFISALTETLDKVKAFTSGGVDYITKPFEPEEVRARVATHLKLRSYQVYLEELVNEKVREISESQLSTIFALARLSESRDHDTGAHLERVQSFCRILAETLCRNEKYRTEIDANFIRNISNASILHDIGKVSIPDAVLLKPGRLDAQEFSTMKTHTVIGENTLLEVTRLYPGNSFITMGAYVARSHHERWDGAGYPDGIAASTIPLAARIMAIADVYDALRSKRCYKEAMNRDQAQAIIVQGQGSQFDPILVDVFKSIESEFDRVWQSLNSMYAND